MYYLLDRYGIQLRYNVIIKKLEGTASYLNSAGDFVSNGIRSYIINLTQLNRFGTESSIDRFLQQVELSNQYNPVTCYLKKLEWDRKDRFPEIMATLGNL